MIYDVFELQEKENLLLSNVKDLKLVKVKLAGNHPQAKAPRTGFLDHLFTLTP